MHDAGTKVDGLRAPTVPIVVLLWSLGGARVQHNRKRSRVSLPFSFNTPRVSINMKVVLPSLAVRATYLHDSM